MRVGRLISIFAASIGIFSVVTVPTLMALEHEGVINFTTDNVRSYTGNYYNEDVLMYSTTLKRGSDINYHEVPTKQAEDDGRFYIFDGWDITGDGIPDISPSQMYFDYNAKACYFSGKIPEIDLNNIDFEKLMEILEKFNISLEDLMKWLNLSYEDLLDKFGDQVLFDVDTSFKGLAYFRNRSFGDFDYRSHKWKDSPFFSRTQYGLGDISPLEFVTDKVAKVYPNLIYDFSFNFDEKNFKDKYCPVPAYEYDGNKDYDTDSYSELVAGEDYTKKGFYVPITNSMITLLRNSSFSSNEVVEAEQKYRNFAKENYSYVNDEYTAVLADLCDEYNLSYTRDGYATINKAIDAVSDLGEYNLEFWNIPSKNDPINYLLENGEGAHKEYNTTLCMLYRYLGLPARYVEGYWAPSTDASVDNIVVRPYIQQHSWVEVYVEDLGWIVADGCSSDLEEQFKDELQDYLSSIPYLPPELAAALGGLAALDGALDILANSKKGSGDLLTDLTSKGPGKIVSNDSPVAAFTSTYTGTAYFMSRALDQYMIGGWESSESSTTYKDANLYVGYAAKDKFEKVQYDVTYAANATYGIYPQYLTETSSSSYEDYAVGPVNGLDQKKFTSYSISTTVNNINKLVDSKFGGNTQIINKEKSYYSYVSNPKKSHYLDILSNEAVGKDTKDLYTSLFTALATSSGLMSYVLNPQHQIADIILEVQRYFQTNYTYDVNYDYGDNELYAADPLLGFLETRRGICAEFATAATLMYRTLGIPARYVVGYGVNSTAGAECNIDNYTAHAWTQVYVGGAGWIDIDCTGFSDGHGLNNGIDNSGTPGSQYGDGFGGGGIKDSRKTIKVSLVFSAKKVYDSYAFDVSDVEVKLNEKESTITSAAFFNAYEIRVDSIEDSNGEPIYKNNVMATIKFRIIERATDKDVTSEFVTAKGEDVGVTKARTTATKAKIQVTTASGTGTYGDYDETNPFSYPVLTVSYEGIDYSIRSLDDHAEIGLDVVIIDPTSVTYLGEVGETPNKLAIKIIDKEGKDVTKSCYSVSYSYGTLKLEL